MGICIIDWINPIENLNNKLQRFAEDRNYHFCKVMKYLEDVDIVSTGFYPIDKYEQIHRPLEPF